MPAKQKRIKVECRICGNDMEVLPRVYKEKEESKLFFCSKDCTWTKEAKQLRYEWSKSKVREKYGVDNQFQRPEVCKIVRQYQKENKEELTEKRKQTYMNHYGVDNPQKCKEIKDRTCKTNIERYGASAYPNSEQGKRELREYSLKKWGKEYFFQTEEFEKLMKEKWGKNYETKPYKWGSPEMKRRNMELYGVENVMQVPEIAELNERNNIFFKFHEIVTPSGKTIRLQGYEPIKYQQLLDAGYNESEILHRKSDMPEIWYEYDGRRRYYPDFYIPKENLVIEVKSKYTYLIEEDKNKEKFKAVKKLGYKFQLEIL